MTHVPVPEDVLVPLVTPPSLVTIGSLCTKADCVELYLSSCLKVLPCGCRCVGVGGEETCMPCVKCELEVNEDFCSICHVDTIEQLPCVRLTCGHVFHQQCVKARIATGYNGASFFSFFFLALV
jgi:E3 ubiquitin-protein ligase MYCBP2